MIFHILLINLSPIFAENELVKPMLLPFGVPRPVGNSLPNLPQMNIAADYVEDVIPDVQQQNIYQNGLNNIKDVARYCPHTEIISRHLNRLCGQPQCDVQIKAALKNYYSLLINALNYRQDVETVSNNVDVVNQLNDINALAQQVLVNRRNNLKVKVSFEYELPTLQKRKCDQLCNALEKYANSMNYRPYNYDDTVQTYNMLFLQKPRTVLSNYPVNLLTENQSQKLPLMLPNNYLPNLDSLLNQNAKLPNSNSLPELLPLLPNSEGIINQNPLQNELPVIQEPVQPLLPIPPTNILSVPSTENSKYEPLNNIVPLLQNPINSFPEGPSYLGPSVPSPYQQYLPPPESNPLNTLTYPQPVLTNSKATENSYPYNPNFIPRPQTYPETPSYYPLQNLDDLTKVANDNPLTNLQNLAKPEGPYPEQLSPLLQNPSLPDYSNPLQKLLPSLQNPANIDSSPVNSLPSPLNPDYLQNSGLSPQNPLENKNSNLPQYFPSLPSNPLQPAGFYPNQNILPAPQSSTEPYYLQNLLPLPAIPKENLYSNPINALPSQLNPLNVFNKQPLGYDNPYPEQNLVLQPQNGLQTQNLLQNLSQSLQSFASSKSYQEYINALNRKYFDMQSYQDLNQNYLTNPTEQGADLSNQKAYATFALSNNNIVLNNKLNELYNIQGITTQLSTENPMLSYLAKLNSNLGTNVLSNVYQRPVTNGNMDSSQIQQYLNYYQQDSGLNNGLYPQYYNINRDLLNQEIQDASKNYIPNTSILNSGLNPSYNSYEQYLNQLQTNSYNRFQIPNSYYNTNLDIAGATENYNVQLQHLNRLLAVSNLYKLNSPPNINGVVELTYQLRHDRPILDPYYYVKYRLPYEKFLANVQKLGKVPNLRNSPNQAILMGSDVSEASNDLKNVQKQELLKLVTTNGTLVNAKLVPTNNTNLDDNLKIVRRLNANMPLRDIIKSDGNYSKLSGHNNPLANYLKAQQNYLKHVQKSLVRNPYNLNPHQPQLVQNNNQLNQQRSYLSHKRQEQNPFMLPRNLDNVITNNYHPNYKNRV